MKKKAPSKINEITAFTIIQPWAEVILHHGKNVENRQKNSRKRGYIAIHSSKTNSPQWFEGCKDFCKLTFDRKKLSFGAVVGFAELVDVITKKSVTPSTRKWFTGKYGLVLKNPIALKVPVPTKGARGSWTLKGSPLKKALSQLTKSQLKKIEVKLINHKGN